MTPREVAEAFSGHAFDRTYDFLADDVGWDLVGAQPLHGKDAVVAACEETAAALAETRTTFESFRVLADTDGVVVDAIARYADPDGTTTRVSSCDLYTIADGLVTAIRSYTVQLDSE